MTILLLGPTQEQKQLDRRPVLSTPPSSSTGACGFRRTALCVVCAVRQSQHIPDTPRVCNMVGMRNETAEDRRRHRVVFGARFLLLLLRRFQMPRVDAYYSLYFESGYHYILGRKPPKDCYFCFSRAKLFVKWIPTQHLCQQESASRRVAASLIQLPRSQRDVELPRKWTIYRPKPLCLSPRLLDESVKLPLTRLQMPAVSMAPWTVSNLSAAAAENVYRMILFPYLPSPVSIPMMI